MSRRLSFYIVMVAAKPRSVFFRGCGGGGEGKEKRHSEVSLNVDIFEMRCPETVDFIEF